MENRNKPQGGFRFIKAFELLWVYFAFSNGLIRWYDLRVWFACHEAVARRCGAKKGVPATYREEEIRRLVGGAGVQCVKRALTRLERVGLLHWSSKAISFGKAPEEIRAEDRSGFWMLVEDFGQANRNVPVPRRTIRFIAAGTRKVLTATMLGQVLRCCYFRRGEYSCEGSCSASWIGRLFGIDERNIKIARKQLLQSGWLLAAKADAWHRQRYGGRAIVNPTWGCPSKARSYDRGIRDLTEIAAKDRSPRKPQIPPKRSPLLILKENSYGAKNQKPALAADRRAGVCKPKREGEHQLSNPKRSPTMRHVEIEDLRDTGRTLELFEDAARQGLVDSNQANRLKFVAAAERALAVGDENPCGLFVCVVRSGLWNYLTQGQEDSASRRLKRHLFADSSPVGAVFGPGGREPDELSHDAKIVMAVKRAVERNRLAVEPFEALRRERPDWNRERWEKAEAQFANSRFTALRAAALHVDRL